MLLKITVKAVKTIQLAVLIEDESALVELFTELTAQYVDELPNPILWQY